MIISVRIGIVTYNSLADLPACFAALRQQTYPHLGITVLDNASHDGSIEWVRQNAPEAEVIASTENLGYGRSHNAITARYPNDYYLALNPDAQLSANYVADLVDALEKNPRAGWATGKLVLSHDDEKPTELRRIYSVGHAMLRDGYAFNIGYGELDDQRFAVTREIFGAPGAAVLFRPELIADLGVLFDPHFFLYNEDTDLDWRAQRAGWTCVYVPDAVALHRGSRPREALRVEALTNRTLSVVKNAYWRDLITYNLPRIMLHTLLRCIVTPRLGLRMTRRLLRLTPAMLRQRRKPQRTYAEMNTWFAWAKQQPGGEAGSFMHRLRVLRQALGKKSQAQHRHPAVSSNSS
jgi:GT2 family glycosyltransferase